MNLPVTRTISVDQLCVGLYVHLDMNWLDHAFARNSFKLKNAAQIDTIKRMGIKEIRVEPARCSTRPLPLTAKVSEHAEIVVPSAEENALISEKRRASKELLQNVLRLPNVKEFAKAGSTLKNIERSVFSRPHEAYADADQLVQHMLDALLADKSIAIHLMNDKIAGEDAYFHSLNVSVLAMMLAKELALPAEDIKAIGIGCLFHDIGKVEIPARIINATLPLNRAEKNLLQLHCQYGLNVVSKLGLPRASLDIIGQHHESMDGSGYPDHLRGDQISLLARIVSVVNTYDNHCNRANPADSLTPFEALSMMFKQQRHLLDSAALDMFIRCMGVYPPGTLVKLSDDSLGMVISINSGKPLRPSVLVYDSSVPKNEAIILDLSQETDIEISASLKPSQLSQEAYDYLSPRKRMSYFLDAPKVGTKKP
ncbi:MAG: HD-GYP domain-containing protein [Simplicispira sp.]|nr:HD-GYP domain-containing protein [Simplicispira sp.]